MRESARRVSLVIACLAGIACSGIVADPWVSEAPILPAPDPFSLNSYDAVHAVLMMRSVPALLHVDADGARTILPVRTVRSFWVGFDPDAYEAHQNRYDVELNGEPLDWDHTFIEYAGSLVNMRLLFTYRNQQPVPDVRYRINPDSVPY